jgi:hypothetical protein
MTGNFFFLKERLGLLDVGRRNSNQTEKTGTVNLEQRQVPVEKTFLQKQMEKDAEMLRKFKQPKPESSQSQPSMLDAIKTYKYLKKTSSNYPLTQYIQSSIVQYSIAKRMKQF